MATWADTTVHAIDAAKIIIPSVMTASAVIVVAGFNQLNSRHTERRTRRLEKLEQIHEQIHVMSNLCVLIFGTLLVATDTQLTYLAREERSVIGLKKMDELPNLLPLASTLVLFGFEGTAAAVRDLIDLQRELTRLSIRPLTNETEEIKQFADKFFEKISFALQMIHREHQGVERSGWRASFADYFRP